jgi:hypothetical protein
VSTNPFLLSGLGSSLRITFNTVFGKKGFSEPSFFPRLLPLISGAGIYVILVSDARWTPRQSRPIYFGETEDFAARVTTRHEHYIRWILEASSRQLYVAQLWMPVSTKPDRLTVTQALNNWYKLPIAEIGPGLATPSLFSPLINVSGASSPPASLRSALLRLMPPPPPPAQLKPLPSVTRSVATSPRLPKSQSVRVFTSFDFDHDESLRTLLVGQARNPDSPFEIHDWSIKEPFKGDWKEKVRKRIGHIAQVAVICGEHTDTAAGVNVEVEIAKDVGKPYCFLAGYSDKTCKLPRAARPSDKLYKWSWGNLKKLIAGAR